MGAPTITVATRQVSASDLMEWDNNLELAKVHNNCRVITQEKVTVIPDMNYNELLEMERPHRTDIVRKSFQFYCQKADKHRNVVPIEPSEETFDPFAGFCRWTGQYDPDFLGYMVNEI